MFGSEYCKEKLSQNLLSRQFKPFIDHNLQLQIPISDFPAGQICRGASPIYCHYIGDNPSISYLPPEVNERELFKAMKDAEQSYEMWLQMKNQLSNIRK